MESPHFRPLSLFSLDNTLILVTGYVLSLSTSILWSHSETTVCSNLTGKCDAVCMIWPFGYIAAWPGTLAPPLPFLPRDEEVEAKISSLFLSCMHLPCCRVHWGGHPGLQRANEKPLQNL